MLILSKGRKPNNLKSHNSLKLSFTYIRGLRSNFVECESFLESNSPDSLSVWDKLGWLNWFWQFLGEGLSPLIWKDSSTHIHGLAVFVFSLLPFAREDNSACSYVCFWLGLLSVSYFLFLYRSLSASLCSFWCYFI